MSTINARCVITNIAHPLSLRSDSDFKVNMLLQMMKDEAPLSFEISGEVINIYNDSGDKVIYDLVKSMEVETIPFAVRSEWEKTLPPGYRISVTLADHVKIEAEVISIDESKTNKQVDPTRVLGVDEKPEIDGEWL